MTVIQENSLTPLGLPDIPALFMYVLPVSITERVLMTVIATVFGVTLLLALFKAGLLPHVSGEHQSSHTERQLEES